MAILQSRLPFALWVDPRQRRLPGIQPLAPEDWLLVDDAFAAQMAERDRLIATRPREVHALLPEAMPAARELLARLLAELRRSPGYAVGAASVTRPDGVTVAIEADRPLLTAGRLGQADLCLMERRGDAHVLTGAILCFPAGWTLAEKLGRPLVRIHAPVREYDGGLAARVQRLFDAIRPEQPLWRVNVLAYAEPALFAPRTEADPRPNPSGRGAFVRSERQCLLRLPDTGAVVFSIHTAVVRRGNLTAEQEAAFAELPPAPSRESA